MSAHGPDPSAVRAWVDRDPILSRLPLAKGGPVVSVVGGAVRDAILGIPHGRDVDLVVEGDAIAFARVVGHAMAGRVVAHERFGTARLEFGHGRHLDLVSARRETYPEPGALPVVAPGTILDDLARRDFTVNAIAYRLSGAAAGAVLDPHGGLVDIADERIRLLRSGAFTEDPSRVVRALRYAARLGFRLEEATEAEARACMRSLDLSSSRVGDELRRMLEEPSAVRALDIAAALGAEWPTDREARDTGLGRLDQELARPGAPDPPVWALRLGVGLTPEAAARTAVAGWARAIAAEVQAGPVLATQLERVPRPSDIDAVLHNSPPATQVGAAIAGAEIVGRWWAQWRDLQPAVSGSDLVAAGVPPGPAIGRALRAVRAAVLDDEVRGAEEQMSLALSIAAPRA